MPRLAPYAGMSVRWAILYLLSGKEQAMTTDEIADVLKNGGVTSNAQRFAGNVSAILSGMRNERQEVEQVAEGYRITQHGRDVWEGIKRTPQWVERHASSIAS